MTRIDLFPPCDNGHLIDDIILRFGNKNLTLHLSNVSLRYLQEYKKHLTHPQIEDIQVPIQTSSARLLDLMGRSPIANEIGEIMVELKRNNPKLLRRTGIIIGMPTETEEEFENRVKKAMRYFSDLADCVVVFDDRGKVCHKVLYEQ